MLIPSNAMIYFIYNANGSFFGEINYFINKMIGREKCGLCELSHNIFFKRKSWELFLDELDAPYQVLHADEVSSEIKKLNFEYPCVVFKKDNSFFELISHNDFKNIDSINDLRNALKKSF